MEIKLEPVIVALPMLEGQDDLFSFKLVANDKGIELLRFRKHGTLTVKTLLLVLDAVNSTFDKPFPNLSDFLDTLADTARTIEKGTEDGEEATTH